MAPRTVSLVVIAAVACCLALPAAASKLGSSGAAGGRQCPPEGFQAAQDFNIETYISAPWYVQKQMPLSYQPRSQLYCVRAEYKPIDPVNIVGKGVYVFNYANEKRVNGRARGTSNGAGPTLVATVPNPAEPSKLQVGLWLQGLERQISPGPYWVVALGRNTSTTPDSYDWAVVSGGPPRVATKAGCRTGSPHPLGDRVRQNDVGLWLFSRKAVDPEATATMLEAVEGLGYDPSVLLDVQQAGCTYAGAEATLPSPSPHGVLGRHRSSLGRRTHG